MVGGSTCLACTTVPEIDIMRRDNEANSKEKEEVFCLAAKLFQDQKDKA